MFILHFIVSNIVISIVIIIIFVLSRIFQSKISAKLSYFLWFFPFMIMGISLIPNINIYIKPLKNFESKIPKIISVQEHVFNLSGQDFFTLKNQNNTLNYIIYIYLIGLLVFMLFLIYGNLVAFATIKKKNINCNRVENIFNKLKYSYNAKCSLVISNRHCSPFSWGIIKPVVFFPQNRINNIDDSELEFIISHEIIHIKHKDLIYNLISCILSSIFWINPLVYLALRKFRLQIELYCDYTLLKSLNPDQRTEYAHTILKFIKHTNNKPVWGNHISGDKKEVFLRIKNIAYFKKYQSNKYVNFFIILIMSVLLTLSILCITAFGFNAEPSHIQAPKNLVNIDLSTYFNGYNGCFVLYNSSDSKYYIYNEKQSQKRFPPNSTYKILMALNALENNIITTENSYRQWDKIEYPFDEWNSDKTLNTAMSASVNWYFQGLDKEMGFSKVKNFLNKLNYGNKAIGLNFNEYWLEDSLKISPIEQVDFLKSVYYNNLNLDIKNIEALKNSLKISENFYGKTGTGNINGKNISGWFVGFAEIEDNEYFFSTYIQSDEFSDGITAREITYKILNDIT